MRAMVFCAGLATRLRPLSELWPKPACPVLNRPLLAYNLALLRTLGVREVAVNTHHLADRMGWVALAEARNLGLTVRISREEILLGHGGGLKAVEPWLRGSTCILLNGDFLFDVDLKAAFDAHRKSGAAATLVVQPPLAGYRPLHAHADGRLACLPGEAPPADAVPWHFTGIHLVEPALFNGLVPEPSGIFETAYRALLRSGATVRVHADLGEWRDVQTPENFLNANLDALAGKVPLGRFESLGRLEAVAFDAEVDGDVEESVIGAGAVVVKGARVRRSVVLPETVLAQHEVLDGAIAAGSLRLAV